MEISDPETNEVKFESLKEISNLKTKSGNDVQFSNTRKHFDLLTFTRDDLENVLLLVLLKFEFEVLLSVTSPEENSFVFLSDEWK
jgi:hypothetical protein